MKRGFDFDRFDDDIDASAAERRARLYPVESAELEAQRRRWAAEDERELRELYRSAGVGSHRR